MPASARPDRVTKGSIYQGPIIDTHIHLFDPSREEGIPWPEKTSPIHRGTLPINYFDQAGGFRVTGAIAVEASPWPRDNDWLLAVCREHPGMVGFVGNFFPEDTNFPAALKRFGAEPLFLGIRYGNLWGRDLEAASRAPRFLAGIQALAETGKVLDSANPDLELLRGLLQLSDRVPDLRIVIDHLPNASIAVGREAEFHSSLAELASRETVSIKLSEVPKEVNGVTELELAPYLDWLEHLWELFGSRRIMFGSDWPNSELTAPFSETVELSLAYLAGKTIAEQEQVLFSNSQHIYRWKSR